MSKDYATEERQFTEFMTKLPEPTQFLKDFKWGEILQWRQYRNYKNDYCDVRIWEKSQNVIVLFSQGNANPSMSITNASEYIATAVKKFVPQARKVSLFIFSIPVLPILSCSQKPSRQNINMIERSLFNGLRIY